MNRNIPLPDARSMVLASPLIALAGILSGLFEGIFLLESVIIPAFGIVTPLLLSERGKLMEMAGTVSLLAVFFLMIAGKVAVDLAFVPPVLVTALVYLISTDLGGVYLAVSAQLMDALSTYLVVSGGGLEKMMVPAIAIEALGPSGIFVLKALVLIPYMVYSIPRDEQLLDYLVFAVGLLLAFHNLAL